MRISATGVAPWHASSIWQKIRERKLPAPERFGARCTRWRVEKIREYLADPKAWETKHGGKGGGE
jgi:predicted DNA-binding transcriptional regulator AlpA